MEINKIQKEIHENAKAHGWWDGEERTFGELIALCHSELSEALEEYRNGNAPDETYNNCKNSKIKVIGDMENCSMLCEDCAHRKPDGIPIELADCVIRVMDMCEHYGIDLEAAILEKHRYNQIRPYKHGGKVI